MDRVHGEEERCDESQAGVFKHVAFTRVYEQAGYGAVQTHIDDVEMQRRHAAQQDVQPDREERQIFSGVCYESGAVVAACVKVICSCVKQTTVGVTHFPINPNHM